MSPQLKSSRRKATSDDGFDTVRKLAAEYRALADAYDVLLMEAHNAGHGTLGMTNHLRSANEMAPAIMEALNRYHRAVAALIDHGRTS
jgi:hypothetical protein